MSKNVYQFYKEFKNVSVGTSVYSFKCYQHKTKLDVWVVKDIKRTTSFSIRDTRYSVDVDYQEIIFSNSDYLSIFTIEDILYEGEDSDVVILDEFENDGLPYLKFLEKDRVHETVWIKKDHEFFDLFFIYYTDDDSVGVCFQLDGEFKD